MQALATLRVEDYQCPPCIKGESEILKLESKGFTGMGRADRAPLPFRLPFDWNGTDVGDRNWMFQLHAWRMLDPYLVLMLENGGQRTCFAHSVAVVTDWIRENVLGEPGPFKWFDMSTGIRASKLSLLARAAPAFNCNLSAIPGFDDMLTGHFTHLMNPKELSKGNHGLFQMQGLKSLSSAFLDHPASSDAEKYAVQNMSRLIKEQMGEHGVHTEDSPHYHFFPVAVSA